MKTCGMEWENGEALKIDVGHDQIREPIGSRTTFCRTVTIGSTTDHHNSRNVLRIDLDSQLG